MRAAQRHRPGLIAVEMQNSDMALYTILFGEGLAGGLQFTYTDGVEEAGFSEIARLGRTIRAAGERLAVTERRVDTAVIWCPDQLYAPYDSGRYGFGRDVRGVIERDIPALATLLIRSGLAFDLLDTEVARAADYRAYRTVWLVASDILPRSAQEHLVAYVEAGGRLICWPEPPTLDEHLEPCSILADRLFSERRSRFHPADAQVVEVLGRPVTVYRGVQTFVLSDRATAFARRAGKPCGYRRCRGRGEAWLLGSWPAADSVPGRASNVFELQQLPASSSSMAAAAAARRLARKHLGKAAAAKVSNSLQRAGAGPPEYLVVYDYPNERRGGEVLAGGTIAYWDGRDIVPVVELNSAEQPVSEGVAPQGASARVPPYRPLTQAHLDLVRRLHGHAPVVRSSDPRAQVRILDCSAQSAATVAVLNRFLSDIETVLETEVGGRLVRLPTRGKLHLPAGSNLLLPIAYELGPGVRIRQSTMQLLGHRLGRRKLALELYSPAGGELILALPARVTEARAGSRHVAVQQSRRGRRMLVRLVLPSGEHTLQLRWTSRGGERGQAR